MTSAEKQPSRLQPGGFGWIEQATVTRSNGFWAAIAGCIAIVVGAGLPGVRERAPRLNAAMPARSSPTAPADTPAPGWLPDPHGVSKLRWWDGSSWTWSTSD